MGENNVLPLFPLNTVLFPGMPLNLHIFEPRYKLMIGECMKENQPFGVVLIEEGNEVGSGATIYRVGTKAQIMQVRKYANGEMDIATLGRERFLVESVQDNKPYMTGKTTDFPLGWSDPEKISAVVARVRDQFRAYLDIFSTLGEVNIDLNDLPTSPMELAFLTAVVLHMPMKEKQHLLAAPDLAALLRLERRMLTRETFILRELVEKGPRYRDDNAPFSAN